MSTGPKIEAMIKERDRELAECALQGHPHRSEFKDGPNSNMTYLECTNCGTNYERPAFPEEIQERSAGQQQY